MTLNEKALTYTRCNALLKAINLRKASLIASATIVAGLLGAISIHPAVGEDNSVTLLPAKTVSHENAKLAPGPTSSAVISWSQSGAIACWDLQQYSLLYEIRDVRYLQNVASSSESNILVIMGNDSAEIRRLDTGELIYSIPAYTDEAMALSSDGSILAVTQSFEDGRHIVLYQTSNGELLRKLKVNNKGVRIAAFSPDSRLLAIGDDRIIKVFDTETLLLKWKLDDHARSIDALLFSPDGRKLASRSAISETKLWDIDTGKRIKTILKHVYCHSMVFARDSKSIFLGTGVVNNDTNCKFDFALRCFDTTKGNQQEINGLHHIPRALLPFGDGQRFAVAGERGINILNPFTGEEAGELRLGDAGANGIVSLCISPDQRFLSAIDRSGILHFTPLQGRGNDNWRINHEVRGENARVSFIDDRKLVVASREELRCWDLKSGKVISSVKPRGPIGKIACSEETFQGGFSIGNEATFVRFIDLKTGSITQENLRTNCGAFPKLHPTESVVAVAGDEVVLFDYRTMKVKNQIDEFRTKVRCLEFSRDGRYLFTLEQDRLQKWAYPECVLELAHPVKVSGPAAFSVSPDCSKVLVPFYKDLLIYDVNSGNQIARHEFESAVQDHCFSHDETFFVVGLGSGQIRRFPVSER